MTGGKVTFKNDWMSSPDVVPIDNYILVMVFRIDFWKLIGKVVVAFLQIQSRAIYLLEDTS